MDGTEYQLCTLLFVFLYVYVYNGAFKNYVTAWGVGGPANADERFKKGDTFKQKTLTKGWG